MYTTTSLRRGKVKRRKPLSKPQLIKENTASSRESFGNYGQPYIPPVVELSWAQRHPAIVVLSSLVLAAAALVTLIYFIPKSAPSTDYETEKKKKSTLSALDPSPTRPGQRSTPTDSSFLSTPYRKNLTVTESAPQGRSQGQQSDLGSSSTVANASYGDGTVTRQGGACQVKATGIGNFADALADCLNGGK